MRKGLLLFLMIISFLWNANAQWTKCNLPSGILPFSLAVSGSTIYLGTLSSGMYSSTDKGASWKEINNGLTLKQIWSVSVVDDAVFVGTNSGGLFRTTDKGNSWAAINSGVSSTTIVRSVVKFNNKLFATTNNTGVLISSDNGASWAQHNSGITGLVAAPLLVVDNDLYVGVMQKVYKYDAANSKWVVAANGIVNNTISALAFMKEQSGTVNLFAGVSDSNKNVYRSTDLGANWVAAYTSLPGVPVATVASKGTTVFAGNDYGVYVSKNMGASWTDASTGFTNSSYATFLSVGDQELYVLQGSAVWKRSFADFGITAAPEINLGGDFANNSLKCYPNPFSDQTNISYQLQNTSEVSLAIYDLTGNAVRQMVSERQQPGSYTYLLMVTNLVPGTYLVKLATNGALQTRKIVVLY